MNAHVVTTHAPQTCLSTYSSTSANQAAPQGRLIIIAVRAGFVNCFSAGCRTGAGLPAALSLQTFPQLLHRFFLNAGYIAPRLMETLPKMRTPGKTAAASPLLPIPRGEILSICGYDRADRRRGLCCLNKARYISRCTGILSVTGLQILRKRKQILCNRFTMAELLLNLNYKK